MNVQTYVKRLRMEVRLRALPLPILPRGYALVPWDAPLLDVHADVKWRSFRDTLDACVFPKLAWLSGCQLLMETITHHAGFVPAATWLVQGPEGYCGCIQGVARDRVGMIQNLGVLAETRGRGLGRALLVAALWGFAEADLRRASLEVSASNAPAVRLYHDLGFQTVKTLYREYHERSTDYTI